MNNGKNKQAAREENAILPEYDFTGVKGVRGKYYKAYQQGHTVKIHQDDGTVTTQYFALEIQDHLNCVKKFNR